MTRPPRAGPSRGHAPALLCGPRTKHALDWAATAHRRHARADGTPFVLHVAETAALVAATGADTEVICAALLHDVLERTDQTAHQLRQHFGLRVATIVAALTQDPTIRDYAPRKAALRRQVLAAGPDARLVFAADKISKARELRARWARRPDGPSDKMLRRRAHYRACLEMLAGAPLVAQLDFELWELDVVARDATSRGAPER